jgi:hypothetical protein
MTTTLDLSTTTPTLTTGDVGLAKACTQVSCEEEGTHRIDVLVVGFSTRLTVFVCEPHYNLCKAHWDAGTVPSEILYCWFRGKV